MYNFVDVTEVAESGIVLPSEALKINGEYIENQIEGYRTLSVSGREALAPIVERFETGIRDGSKLKNKRYPERTIIVKYQIAVATNEAFREAYNKLGRILDVKEAELIFNDEQDKFFIGTPSYIGEVDPGKNAVVGEFEILCTDPFKYSCLEYTATPNLDNTSVLIDYNGTYKSYPTLQAEIFNEYDVSEDGETGATLTGGGDCGYIAFFDENENIIQIGDPDEVDGETAYAKSQTLVNQSFDKTSSWGTAAKELWETNNGVALPSDVAQLGSVGMDVASYAVPSNPASTSATLLNRKQSDAGRPVFYYTVTAKTSGRTANTINVNVAITTALQNDGSYFGHGYGIKGSLYIGDDWHDIVLKTTSEYWRGRTGHTKNMSFTVSGLSESQLSITGIQFKVERTDSLGGNAGKLASVTCSNLPISDYVADVPETYYLNASSYGSASGWHGAFITRTLPADEAGETGAKDFTFTYKQKMSIGNASSNTNQRGAFQAMLSDANGVVIAGVRICKNAAGKQATIVLYVNGENVWNVDIDLSYNNDFFGVNGKKTSSITKIGSKITFNIGGYKMAFTNTDVATLKTTKITLGFEQYSTAAALSYNGLYSVKFVKNNCNTWKDIPNKFSAGDIVQADCKDGEIYLNGVSCPEYGALGNDWEGFYLTPGLNQIGFSFSDWVTAGCEPSITVRYREVFI